MVTPDQLEQSKRIQRRTGRTFHIATRFLPERTRHATYVLYAFFRMADQVVDDPDPPSQSTQVAKLERMRRAALGETPTSDDVLSAFAEVRDRHGIADQEVNAFIDAMKLDAQLGDEGPRIAFEDETERERYLRGSAVAVAQMMLAVMDPPRPDLARPHAAALGEAFQLTNFLRDIREDVEQYGRIYIPRSTLEQFDVSISDFHHGGSERLRSAIAHDLKHAESRYRTGVAGIRMLPDGCQYPVLLASVLYADYHQFIRQAEYDVLSDPPSLGLSRYARVWVSTRWNWQQMRDPEFVFYRVSPISPTPLENESDRQNRTSLNRVARVLNHARPRWFR